MKQNPPLKQSESMSQQSTRFINPTKTEHTLKQLLMEMSITQTAHATAHIN